MTTTTAISSTRAPTPTQPRAEPTPAAPRRDPPAPPPRAVEPARRDPPRAPVDPKARDTRGRFQIAQKRDEVEAKLPKIDPGLQKDLDALRANDSFKKLTRGVQDTTVREMSRHPNKPGDALDFNPLRRGTISELATDGGFAKLAETDQTRLLRYIGGTNREISEPARMKLDFLTESDGWKKGDAAKRAELLQTFMKDQPGAHDLIGDTNEDFVKERAKATIGKPEEIEKFAFKAGKADALKYSVKVGEQTITVYAPKNPDKKNGYFHDVDQIAKSLGALPPEVRERIRQINLEPDRNPEDAYWAKQYKNPDFRAYASASPDGAMWFYPAKGERNQSFLDTNMFHEAGHVLSEQAWGAWQKEGSGWKDWKAAGAKDGFSPSKYARNSLGEDFSEALALYQRVRGTPQEEELRGIMPERFAILDTMLKAK